MFAENGKQVEEKFLYTKTWNRNPLACNTIIIELNNEGSETFSPLLDDNDDDVTYTFEQSELFNVNGQTGTFEYRSGDGSRLKLTREKTQTFNYFGAL